MAMTGAGLGEAIRTGMGFPLPLSNQLTGWGKGVILYLQANLVLAHASGLVTGSCPPGSPLSGGAATGGVVSGLVGDDLSLAIHDEVGPTDYPGVVPPDEMDDFNGAIVAHIQAGLGVFTAGQITGTCTNTPSNPGPLVGGAGAGGSITGMSGAVLAAAVHTAVGYPGGSETPGLIAFCTSLVDYIATNGDLTYSSGVTGTCPAGGGALSGGTGTGGFIL